MENDQEKAFCLVFWPEEMQVSVVARGTLQEGNIVGDSCSVTVGRQVHKGSILAIGTEPDMDALADNPPPFPHCGSGSSHDMSGLGDILPESSQGQHVPASTLSDEAKKPQDAPKKPDVPSQSTLVHVLQEPTEPNDVQNITENGSNPQIHRRQSTRKPYENVEPHNKDVKWKIKRIKSETAKRTYPGPATAVLPNTPIYHGKITSAEAKAILHMYPGKKCYLIRFSENTDTYILSIKSEDEFFHFDLEIDNVKPAYSIKSTNQDFDALDKLLEHYETNPMNATIRSIGSPCKVTTSMTKEHNAEYSEKKQNTQEELEKLQEEKQQQQQHQQQQEKLHPQMQKQLQQAPQKYQEQQQNHQEEQQVQQQQWQQQQSHKLKQQQPLQQQQQRMKPIERQKQEEDKCCQIL